MKYKIILILLSIALFSCQKKEEIVRYDFKEIYEKYETQGCFVLYDLSNKQTVRYNPSRCEHRLNPGYTFLLPFAFIAFESNALQSMNDTIKWNNNDHGDTLWNQDQDFISAYKNKCNWYFKDIAIRIGDENMVHWLKEMPDFGNMLREGQLDKFWYDGSFVVSTNEWLDFLIQFKQKKLPFKKDFYEDISKLFTIQEINDEQVHKFITAYTQNSKIAWQMGFIKKNEKNYIFINNASILGEVENAEKEIEKITDEIFHFIGIK